MFSVEVAESDLLKRHPSSLALAKKVVKASEMAANTVLFMV
ncbi:hypothetical protein VCHA51O444_10087 [Vibrio chagasii]|nr:hypothetical protein VCHA51O444_10087 [Vibrio chagasii]CAH7225846.1 hypothetical protein VCHA53O474_240084 [Vibrio chagasii]